MHRYLAPGGVRHGFASLAHFLASLCAQAQDLFGREGVKRDGAGAKAGKGGKGKGDAKGGKVPGCFCFPRCMFHPGLWEEGQAGMTGSGSPATSGQPTIRAGRATRKRPKGWRPRESRQSLPARLRPKGKKGGKGHDGKGKGHDGWTDGSAAPATPSKKQRTE